MTHHDDRVSFRQMLAHSREICDAVSGFQRDEFFSDRFRELALFKLFEMVGESASRVSDDTKRQYPAIPWRAVIGARNRLSHECDSVDYEVIWDAAQEHIPELIAKLEEILNQQ